MPYLALLILVVIFIFWSCMHYLALAQKVLGESWSDPLLDSNVDPDLNILVIQYLDI